MKHAHRNACSWREAAEDDAVTATLIPAGTGYVGNVLAHGLDSTHAMHTAALWALVWLLTDEETE